MKKHILLITLLFTSLLTQAQVKIGDNPTTINPSSLLELESTNKALLITRVPDVASVNNPVDGMIVYDIAMKCTRAFQDGIWSECLGVDNGGTAAAVGCDGLDEVITFGNRTDGFAFSNDYHGFLSANNYIYQIYPNEIGANTFAGVNSTLSGEPGAMKTFFLDDIAPGKTWVDHMNPQTSIWGAQKTVELALASDGDLFAHTIHGLAWDTNSNGVNNLLAPYGGPGVATNPSSVWFQVNDGVNNAAGSPLKIKKLLWNNVSAYGSGALNAYRINVDHAMFLLGTDDLIYSYGNFATNYNGGTTSFSAAKTNVLFRAVPNYTNSLTPKPATDLNTVLTRNGTKLADIDVRGVMHNMMTTYYSAYARKNTAYLVGEDGYLYILNTNGKNYKASLPNGAKVISLNRYVNDANQNSAICIGDDGKIYTLSDFIILTSSYTPTTLDQPITITQQYGSALNVSGVKFTEFSLSMNEFNNTTFKGIALTDDGDVYYLNSSSTPKKLTGIDDFPKVRRLLKGIENITYGLKNYYAETTTGQVIAINPALGSGASGSDVLTTKIKRGLDGVALSNQSADWELASQCTNYK